MPLHARPISFLRLVALLCALVLAAGACGGGDDDGDEAAVEGGDPTTETYEGSVDLEAGMAIVAGSAGEATIDRAIVKKVLATVGGYVDAAVVEPLLSGKDAKKLERFFGLRVIARIGPDGEDRPSLTDEGLPEIAADLEAEARPVDLDGLVDPGGTVLMVGASLDLDIATATAEGPLTISRVGDLILEPDADGDWQITGYDIEVRRRSRAGTTTTTASSTASSGSSPTEAP